MVILKEQIEGWHIYESHSCSSSARCFLKKHKALLQPLPVPILHQSAAGLIASCQYWYCNIPWLWMPFGYRIFGRFVPHAFMWLKNLENKNNNKNQKNIRIVVSHSTQSLHTHLLYFQCLGTLLMAMEYWTLLHPLSLSLSLTKFEKKTIINLYYYRKIKNRQLAIIIS